MSDISILSRRYDNVAKLSSNLNEAILLLKKAALKASQPAIMWVREGSEEDKAREFLGQFVGQLVETHDGGFSEAGFPHPIIEALQKVSRNEPGFHQKLKNLHHDLTEYQDLTQENFTLLDKLLSIIDAEASAAFNKLWRKR